MHSSLKKLAAVLLAAACCLQPLAASATTTTSDMTVSMNIAASCAISSPPSLDLGSVTDLSTQHTADTTIPLSCSNGATYKLIADNGAHYDSVNSIRRMANGTNYISYSIYTDSGYASAFPTTLAAATAQAGTGSVVNIPIYAKVTGQALPPVGSYADTVTLTVNY
jgi:spore coat protein U-like protein